MPETEVLDLPGPVLALVERLPGLTTADLLVGLATPAGHLPALPAGRPPRPAAVLLLLSPGPAGVGQDFVGPVGSGLDVVLVERSARGAHAGQVALPGGGVDPDDGSPEEAALREADEETGVDPRGVVVLGVMPELPVPVSGYLVTPVLGWEPEPSVLAPGDPAEITDVRRVPLAVLADPAHRVAVCLPTRPVGPGFVVGDLLVWGFTALLLDALLRLSGLERPWDRARAVDLPARFAGGSR